AKAGHYRRIGSVRLQADTTITVAVAVDERRITAQSELFTKEQMPPRFAARQASAVPAGFACRLNGVDDPSVPGAAAQMAVERLRYRVTIAGHALTHQRNGADHDAWDAEPALHAPVEHKRLAQH